ncbi:hypothetical protein [Nocardiopsis metallicus]|uniref:Uncharacterized protein n=1 Tax=Nocardiopsis metallicus TaxID=179819 RepID=A0A840WCJ1_9ACTN|nr:hypothetical protein [Nocardiopsis metallicus]MBB5490741.1 hypothetical protein [Nocardiopsis metallicus]
MALPSIFFTVLDLALALFFAVTGVLILARARRVPRARGVLLTAAALMLLYAIWSATVRTIMLTYPPILAVPGETPPELSPVQAFNYEVLQPAWYYANGLLVVAVVVLLLIALPRSRTANEQTGPGPAGPHPYRPGPHQAQTSGDQHRGPRPQGPPPPSRPPHGDPQRQAGPPPHPRSGPQPQQYPYPQVPQVPQTPHGPQGSTRPQEAFPQQQPPPAPPKRPGRHRAPEPPE